MSAHEVQDHPYAPFIHRIEKPVRYLGGEHGSVRKPWDSVRARVALAFPDLYDIGMSHLGFKILYGILNEHPSTLAERIYAPWKDMERELRARDLPLVSLETARPLRDFDVVGFSLQFELTFTNILLMLELGGIPLRSENRAENDPLVLAGGPTATHGEPLADFIDAFVIGDGERACVEVALMWSSLRDAGVPRAKRLEALMAIEGVYVPSLYETAECPATGLHYVSRPKIDGLPKRIRRAFVGDLDQYPFPSTGPVAATETVFDRISVEIARGCTEGCRFCQAGMIYRPVRERSPEQIVETIVNAVRAGGYDEASLTSLSTADYSCISPLIKKVNERLENDKVSLSVSSLRAYGLDEDLLDELQKVRATGLTFAPEAGTQRMRDVVNKNITEEQLMQTAERVFSRGYSRMKLYFMIGLPTEEDEDVLGIVETGRKAREVGKKALYEKGGGKSPNVTVSVSTHVPKPHTPFQWCAMDTLDEIMRKQRLIRDGARRAKVELRMHQSDGSTIEGVLARGDRRLGNVIERAYTHGARFDSWEDCLNIPAWNEAFAFYGVDVAKYLGTLPVDAKLPWDHIDVGLEDGFLLREYRKSLASRLSPPCGKAAGMFVHHTNLEDAQADGRKLVCYDCGVACDLTQMREERLVALDRLAARKRPVVTPELVEGADGEGAVPAARTVERINDRKVPRGAKIVQGEARRVRIAFERLGRAAFQGHLDLIRVVPRVFRRADIELYYSQGFHPKPEMVFGPALSLGIATLDEYVDVKVAQDVDTDTLPGLLQLGVPEGVHFKSAQLLSADDKVLNKCIEHTEYVAALSWTVLRELGIEDEAALDALVRAKSAETLIVQRTVDKGIARKVDVSAMLDEIVANEGAEAVARAGYAGSMATVRFITKVTPNGTCKPTEVISAIFGDTATARYVRTAMGRYEGNGVWSRPSDLSKWKREKSEKSEKTAAEEPASAEPAAETL